MRDILYTQWEAGARRKGVECLQRGGYKGPVCGWLSTHIAPRCAHKRAKRDRHGCIGATLRTRA